jgi:hypothetical protein
LVLQFSLFEQTGELLERAAPDLKFGPQSMSDGISAFYNFDQPLSAEDAASTVRELQVCFILPLCQ